MLLACRQCRTNMHKPHTVLAFHKITRWIQPLWLPSHRQVVSSEPGSLAQVGAREGGADADVRVGGAGGAPHVVRRTSQPELSMMMSQTPMSDRMPDAYVRPEQHYVRNTCQDRAQHTVASSRTLAVDRSGLRHPASDLARSGCGHGVHAQVPPPHTQQPSFGLTLSTPHASPLTDLQDRGAPER